VIGNFRLKAKGSAAVLSLLTFTISLVSTPGLKMVNLVKQEDADVTILPEETMTPQAIVVESIEVHAKECIDVFKTVLKEQGWALPETFISQAQQKTLIEYCRDHLLPAQDRFTTVTELPSD
jgi:hypothetical protein